MTRLSTLLLAALAGAALAWWALHEPPAAPAPEPAREAVAALPLDLPAVPASPASPAALPSFQPAVPIARAAPAAPAAPTPRIGSEGYGPHIERAQAGDDATAAWEAVRWLRDCKANETRRGTAEKLRAQSAAPEFMTHRMQELDAEARRCQTVTAAHRAALPELASRAMRAGVPEAASAYAEAMFADGLSPEQRREVADAMRRDANAGHEDSLMGAALSHESWGLSPAERLAFLYAYGELPERRHNRSLVEAMLKQDVVGLKARLTPNEMAAAKLAGQQIAERVRASGRP